MLAGKCAAVLILGAFLSLTAAGQNAVPPASLQLDGKTYAHLELISTNGEMVTFESDQGPVSAKWKELPEPLRQRFTRDYEESLKREEEATVATMDIGKPTPISGTIFEKLPQGLIIKWNDELILLTGHPSQAKFNAGDAISTAGRRTGLFEYTKAPGAKKYLRKFRVAASLPATTGTSSPGGTPTR